MIPMRNLFTPRTMDVLRITLYEQPALSPLVGISFIVLLNTPYKWIICSDIYCMQISGFDCTTIDIHKSTSLAVANNSNWCYHVYVKVKKRCEGQNVWKKIWLLTWLQLFETGDFSGSNIFEARAAPEIQAV